MSSNPTVGQELPDRYQKDLLELMVVNPHTLYIYWEISNRKRWLVSQHFECDWGAMPKVIRVYDVTCVFFNGNNANYSFDIQTSPEANNWYIQQVKAGASYMVDLGTYSYEGQFIPLLRSKTVVTPRDYSAAPGEPIIGTVPEVANGANKNQRIMPHFHENFNIYAEYAK